MSYIDNPASASSIGAITGGACVNLDGVCVFDGQVGSTLTFRGIKSESAALTAALDAVNKTVDLTLDADLDALAALGTTGFAARTGAGTWALRALTSAADLSITNPSGVAGDPVLDLALTGVVAGSYGSATQVGTFTVDTKGRLTAAANVTITAYKTIQEDGVALPQQPTLNFVGSTLTATDDFPFNRTSVTVAQMVEQLAVFGGGDGLIVHDSVGNQFLARTLVAPAAGITISNANGVAGNPTFALANDLLALEGLAGTGIAVRSAANTWVQRSIAVTDTSSVDLTITNGDGVSGNPTLSAVVLPAGVDHGGLGGLADDDHTQYALLAGRSGGQVLIGGTAAGNNLTLKGSSNTATDEGMLLGWVEDHTHSVSTREDFLLLGGASGGAAAVFTLSGTPASPVAIIEAVPELKFTVGPNNGIALGFISNLTVIRATATQTISQHSSMFDGSSVIADGAITLTLTGNIGTFDDNPFYDTANGGAFSAAAAHCGFTSRYSQNAGTIATRRGYRYRDATMFGGTLTNQIGLEIDALTAAGTLNLGIRCAANVAYTPGSAQAISAAGNAIAKGRKVVLVSNTTAGSITLTSAPTVADGDNGEELVIIGATGSTQNIVVQDQGTLAGSNLRLGAATRTITARDVLRLRYLANVGDWVEESFNTVI